MARARLEVTDTLGTRTVSIDKNVFEIGRRSGHDLHLGGADVSRDHAAITRTGDRFTLKDRGSRSGTFINGEPIFERLLEHGDRIHLGRSNGADLVFVLDETASALSTTAVAGGELHQVAALLEALRALGSGRVLDEVLELVLDSAISVTGAERGFIMLADASGRLELKLARGRGRVTISGQTFETSRKIPEEVFATGTAAVVSDLLDADLASGHMGTIALGIRHVLCVPLQLVHYLDRAADVEEPRRIGVLYLDSRDRGMLLSSTTRTALETLAVEAALAIENARLYRETLEKARLDQQMKIAADIQQALLPKSRHSGIGFELACASFPSLAIGGDFFDYLDLPDGRFAFIVGDVSGKGLPAALLTAVLQGIFAIEAALGHPPSASLARFNETMFRKAVEGRFATLFYGVLASDGRLTYVNAGHNPPIVIGTAGLRRLSTGGTIVGAFPESVYEQETVALDPGDILVIFSDGVTEAFNEQWEEFGDDRLVACVTANCERLSEEMLGRIVDTVKAFTGNAAASDDMTVLVLRRSGRN